MVVMRTSRRLRCLCDSGRVENVGVCVKVAPSPATLVIAAHTCDTWLSTCTTMTTDSVLKPLHNVFAITHSNSQIASLHGASLQPLQPSPILCRCRLLCVPNCIRPMLGGIVQYIKRLYERPGELPLMGIAFVAFQFFCWDSEYRLSLILSFPLLRFMDVLFHYSRIFIGLSSHNVYLGS